MANVDRGSSAVRKGSQRWLQIAVNRRPAVIDTAIREAGVACNKKIEWLSPLESESFDEYRDAEFLNCLGVRLDDYPLRDFWPSGGPQWDGLGRSGTQLLLVEAKANVSELQSECRAKARRSIRMIDKALRETQEFLGAESDRDWSRPYYQYANRLAHLYLLRELNSLDVYLVFVYFVNDRTKMPTSREDWRGPIQETKKSLGLPLYSDWLGRYAKEVFIDTAELSDVEWPPEISGGSER